MSIDCPTTDHGAVGFCTDHGQAALDVAAIRARSDRVGRLDGRHDRLWIDAAEASLDDVPDLLAEVARLRAVGPIAWTFGQRARADRAEATVARVEAAAATAIDTLARMRLTSVAIGHEPCAEAQQEAIEHLRAGLRPLSRERYDAVLDSGPTDEDEGADCG